MSNLNQRKSKFSFDEIVEIINPEYDHILFSNKKGYVAGMAIDDHNQWGYGVCLFETEEVWSFEEEDLKSTGDFVPAGFNRSGETIRVVVNDKSEGEIKEDN
jgi:hypothetical protein